MRGGFFFQKCFHGFSDFSGLPAVTFIEAFGGAPAVADRDFAALGFFHLLLEDYEKAKIPAPQEPTRKIELLQNYVPVSFEYLVDRKQLFLTSELSVEFGLVHAH